MNKLRRSLLISALAGVVGALAGGPAAWAGADFPERDPRVKSSYRMVVDKWSKINEIFKEHGVTVSDIEIVGGDPHKPDGIKYAAVGLPQSSDPNSPLYGRRRVLYTDTPGALIERVRSDGGRIVDLEYRRLKKRGWKRARPWAAAVVVPARGTVFDANWKLVRSPSSYAKHARKVRRMFDRRGYVADVEPTEGRWQVRSVATDAGTQGGDPSSISTRQYFELHAYKSRRYINTRLRKLRTSGWNASLVDVEFRKKRYDAVIYYNWPNPYVDRARRHWVVGSFKKILDRTAGGQRRILDLEYRGKKGPASRRWMAVYAPNQ